MKPNKGFITVFMMVLISISLSTFSRAAFDTFSDVPNDSPFHESIFYLAERGIVCGEGNGRYVPDAPVTVRQWATMLCRALGDADPLNYDDDCIRQGYSDGWLEMTAITAPDSDLCRYAIYKSGFAAFGVDLYSLQLYPNEGKLSQQSEVLRAAADFGLCEDTCDGTEIITRGEAAELLYALLTKTFAVVPPPSQIEVSPSVLESAHDGLTDEEREDDFLNILDACELTGFTPGTALVFENAIERLYYSDSYRIGNATLPQSRVRAKLRRLDGMILREAERKLHENQEQSVKNSTAYTMAVLFNCIAESESDLLVDPYLNALSSTA